jgi:hypothetical protein
MSETVPPFRPIFPNHVHDPAPEREKKPRRTYLGLIEANADG